MGLDKPNKTTPLFVDVDLATQLLHKSHGEFLALPRIEKKKLRLYYRVRVQKDQEDERRRKMEIETKP